MPRSKPSAKRIRGRRSSRALAILHTCMFDAWAAYDEHAVGTRLDGFLRRPAAEHTEQNKATAVSFAAYAALIPTALAADSDVIPPVRRA